MALDSDLTIGSDLTLVVVNGLTLNSVLTLASSGTPSELRFNGTQTLSGTGRVVFGGTADQNYLSLFNGSLTIAAGLTVRGASGTIGNAFLPLTNEGTISADVAGGDTIVIRANPFAI